MINLTDLQKAIAPLREAWEKAYPRSAAGGHWAISGFHYQFVSVLFESVQAWVGARSLGRTDNSPTVFTEILSDMVHAESGEAIIVTQIKRSLTPAKIRAALGDLWSVHSTAVEFSPNLLPFLRYHIQAASGDLSKVESIANTWIPPTDALQETVDLFRAALTADILADPEDNLLTLLANEFRAENPVDQIRTWLGLLLGTAGGAEGFRVTATEIWNDLQRLSKQREERPGGIYFWKACDRPPSNVIRGQVLIGERPQVHHLREGYFSNRESLYNELTYRIVEWTTQSRQQSDKTLRLPVFWIGGRSGCGKSAALLHLLAALHAQGFGPILWLGNRPEKLPEAVRWCRHLNGPEKQPLIAIDDPFGPDAQETGELWNAALNELEDLRQNGEAEALPLTICCGPTEQAQRLKEDYGADLLIVQIELPPEQADEIRSLRSWYRERTNEEAPHLERDEDVLLVQLFFQWRVGEHLRDFARRFLTRIQASDEGGKLERILARVLALNRLYVGYPTLQLDQNLGPHLRGMLDQLRAEHHLAEYADARRYGTWLAHPHLSNAIYTAWYLGPRNIHVRAAHLKAAIDDSLNVRAQPSRQYAPLWALSRALSPEHIYRNDKIDRMADRVDREQTLPLLSDIYATRAGNPDRLIATSELPVWVDLIAIVPDLHLEPHPADVAIQRLREANLEEKGLRLTCHKVLQHLERFDESRRVHAAAAVVSLLTLRPEWNEWAPVALDALWHTQHHEVSNLISDWLVNQKNSLHTGRILARALHIASDNQDLLRAAEILLPGAPTSFDWGDVACYLLDHTDTPPEVVHLWAERNQARLETCFVLAKLIRKGYDDAVLWGQNWAELWHSQRSANYLLEPLWDRGVSSSLLRKWCLVWIKNCPPGADASFVLEKLVQAFPDDQEIRKVTREWMSSGTVKSGAWRHVWRALKRTDPSDPDLVIVGRQWLKDAPPEHGSWQIVWNDLRKHSPDDPELREIGRQWLRDVPPEHESWKYVWEDLRKHSPEDPELYVLGRQWLQEAPPEHASWQFVWKALREDSPDDPELGALGRQWLKEAPPNHESWQYVWEDLHKDSPEDPGLCVLGRQWLQEASPEHASWQFGWKALREDSPDDPELRALGLLWQLNVGTTNPSWPLVWHDLYMQIGNETEIAILGREWLNQNKMTHGSWSFIWEALIKSNPDDEDLQVLGRKWLDQNKMTHGSGSFVWEALIKSNPDDKDLQVLGRKWLNQNKMTHGSWSFIWEALIKSHPNDEDLLALGRRFLVQVPVSNGSWPHTWRACHEVLPNDAELEEECLSWLEKMITHKSWIRAFEPLWNTGRHRNRLVRLARRRFEEMHDGKGSELLAEILAEYALNGSLDTNPDASVNDEFPSLMLNTGKSSK